jgi:hypothetical protein
MKNNITDFKSKYPELHLHLQQFKIEEFPFLYHATRLSSAKSIVKNGFKISHYGEIHGEQVAHPLEKTTYFSRHETSNNLNLSLFDTKEQIVIIKVDATFLNPLKMYPDDGMFDGYNIEELFFDVEDMSEDLGLSVAHCQAYFNDLEQTKDVDLAEMMKPFTGWYLHAHGEISITHNVSNKSILEIVDYDTGQPLKNLLIKKNGSKKLI